MIDLNARAKEVHDANYKWWHDLHTGERLERNKGELLMLVVSEIAECMEGERKSLYDNHLPHRLMAEVEMADAYIRLLDYAGAFDIPISTEVVDKELNAVKEFIPENKGEGLFAIVLAITSMVDNESDYLMVSFVTIFAYCEKHGYGYDLEGAYQEKMLYNATRADHQKEARLADGGKKW